MRCSSCGRAVQPCFPTLWCMPCANLIRLSLIHISPYEDATGEADDAIEPERPGCAQSAVQHREGIRQDEAGGPKGEGAYRHGHAPYAVGEYFGDDDPHGRSQRHGVAGDGGHHDDEQHDSADMEDVYKRQDEYDLSISDLWEKNMIGGQL